MLAERAPLLQQKLLQKFYRGIKLKILVLLFPEPVALIFGHQVPHRRTLFLQRFHDLLRFRYRHTRIVFPATTSMGFLIFSMLFMGAIFSRKSCIFGSRSSPYSTRRKSRR